MSCSNFIKKRTFNYSTKLTFLHQFIGHRFDWLLLASSVLFSVQNKLFSLFFKCEYGYGQIVIYIILIFVFIDFALYYAMLSICREMMFIMLCPFPLLKEEQYNMLNSSLVVLLLKTERKGNCDDYVQHTRHLSPSIVNILIKYKYKADLSMSKTYLILRSLWYPRCMCLYRFTIIVTLLYLTNSTSSGQVDVITSKALRYPL